MSQQTVPLGPGIAQREILCRDFAHAAPLEIVAGSRTGRTFELAAEIKFCLGNGGAENFPLFPVAGIFLPASLVLRKGDTAPLCQSPHGLGKVEPLLGPDELESIAAGAAPEAMKDLLIRIHGKGRRFFRMERAEADIILARFFEGDIARHQIDDVDAVPYPVYDVFGVQFTSSAPPPSLLRRLQTGLRAGRPPRADGPSENR